MDNYDGIIYVILIAESDWLGRKKWTRTKRGTGGQTDRPTKPFLGQTYGSVKKFAKLDIINGCGPNAHNICTDAYLFCTFRYSNTIPIGFIKGKI